MRFKTFFTLLLCLSWAATSVGLKAEEITSLKPVEVTFQEYKLSALDKIIVTLPDKDGSYKKTLTVSQEGTIQLGDETLNVAGQDVKWVNSRLARSFPKNAKIFIEEFRPSKITVLGEVYHQILSEMPEGPMRLTDAIATANGFTAIANRKRVRLIRQNADRISVYEINMQDILNGKNVEQNVLLEPGDIITVPRNFL